MNIKDCKAIIILFAPGQGGNHLANIISTSPYVENRMLSDDYNKDLEFYYRSNNKNAHLPGGIDNVGVMDVEGLQDTLMKSKKTYVIAGHIDETYYIYEYIKNLGSYIFITFENFNLTESIKKRMKTYDESLIKFLYRKTIVSKLFDTDNVMTLDTAKLFDEDPHDLFIDLSRELSLDLDLDFCMNLHKLWYKKINK